MQGCEAVAAPDRGLYVRHQQGGRIGGENGMWRAQLIQLAVRVPLDVQALKD